MDIKPEDFKFTPKETASLLATVVLTGLAVIALWTATKKKKETDDE
jgi:hypothetical protein